MARGTIQITILNNKNIVQCDAECGVDWSSPEAVTLAKQRIKERFGNRAQLEYIDLSEAAKNHRLLEPGEGIKDLSLPVLLINGHPRIAGQFDLRQLLDAIEAEMEITA